MTAGSSLVRILSVATVCALLGGCGAVADTTDTADLVYPHARHTTPAGPPDNPTLFPDDLSDSQAPASVEGTHLQCVPYARAHSSVNLRGDAYTWWDKAAGLYARNNQPSLGSVLVLDGYSRRRAHVAVVRRMISPREIRVDHANWLNDGAIYVNDPVVDVSVDNDWSQVKVWNVRQGSWGVKTYHVQGFIGPGPQDGSAVVAAYHPQPQQDDPIARQIAADDADAADGDH